MRRKRPIKLGVRFKILERDNHRCAYCGASAPEAKLHVDHIIPASLGGTEDEDNLITACGDCNIGKHTRLSTHTLDTKTKDINELIQSAIAHKERIIQNLSLEIKEKNKQLSENQPTTLDELRRTIQSLREQLEIERESSKTYFLWYAASLEEALASKKDKRNTSKVDY